MSTMKIQVNTNKVPGGENIVSNQDAHGRVQVRNCVIACSRWSTVGLVEIAQRKGGGSLILLELLPRRVGRTIVYDHDLKVLPRLFFKMTKAFEQYGHPVVGGDDQADRSRRGVRQQWCRASGR